MVEVIATFQLDWQGDALVGRIREVASRELGSVLAEAAERARAYVPVVTGTLRDSITYRVEGLRGYLGSWGVHYAIYVEMGTIRMAPRLFLRRAADEVFPMLATRLQGALR